MAFGLVGNKFLCWEVVDVNQWDVVWFCIGVKIIFRIIKINLENRKVE